GMLHDCAKNLSEQEQLQFCRKHHIDVTEVEEENTALLHAKNGEWMSAHKYHIDDPEILGAIRWHTTGRPGMTLLEKIIYVADFIEPNRKKLECLPAIRQEAYRDIDATVYHIAEAVTGFLSTQGKATDDMSMKTLRYYQDILEGRRKDGGTE
ncbi:MAG: bis(5'-nucleosyl)-tetraphosphatase (symmetrical) YqeK, partial [Butyrivibrio sp.]|nr:bis(5'-nucleosyl)-tetraphosphatase (symmetrical) YqeK [Butyrivibrio sp.]